MNKQSIPKNNVVITGEWDGQPIWREKTPKEKAIEASGNNPKMKKAIDLLEPFI